MGGVIASDAQQKLLYLPGVEEADVELVWGPALALVHDYGGRQSSDSRVGVMRPMQNKERDRPSRRLAPLWVETGVAAGRLWRLAKASSRPASNLNFPLSPCLTPGLN